MSQMTSTHKKKILHTNKAALIRARLRVSLKSLADSSQNRGASPELKYLFRSKYSIKIEKSKRTSYKVLPPIRFIDLISNYRTVGDLSIFCKNGQYDPEDIYDEQVREMFLPLSTFKRFSKAEYDENLGIFSIDLESFNYEFHSAKFIVERLQSLQDREAYEVSKLIKIYNEKVKQEKLCREKSREEMNQKLIIES